MRFGQDQHNPATGGLPPTCGVLLLTAGSWGQPVWGWPYMGTVSRLHDMADDDHDQHHDCSGDDYIIVFDYYVHHDGCSHHVNDNDDCPHNHDNLHVDHNVDRPTYDFLHDYYDGLHTPSSANISTGQFDIATVYLNDDHIAAIHYDHDNEYHVYDNHDDDNDGCHDHDAPTDDNGDQHDIAANYIASHVKRRSPHAHRYDSDGPAHGLQAAPSSYYRIGDLLIFDDGSTYLLPRGSH